jgi:hypothetical protein
MIEGDLVIFFSFMCLIFDTWVQLL